MGDTTREWPLYSTPQASKAAGNNYRQSITPSNYHVSGCSNIQPGCVHMVNWVGLWHTHTGHTTVGRAQLKLG